MKFRYGPATVMPMCFNRFRELSLIYLIMIDSRLSQVLLCENCFDVVIEAFHIKV